MGANEVGAPLGDGTEGKRSGRLSWPAAPVLREGSIGNRHGGPAKASGSSHDRSKALGMTREVSGAATA
jgi:hypothetical protein